MSMPAIAKKLYRGITGFISVIFLASFFILGGIIFPLSTAPVLFAETPILAQAKGSATSPFIYLSKVNFASGERFMIYLDDASNSYMFESLSYTCVPGVYLSYIDGSKIIPMPCDTVFVTPNSTEPVLLITADEGGKYTQINVTLEKPDRQTTEAASAVVSVGFHNADESVLRDDVTLKSL